MRSVKGKISLFQCWLPITVMNLDGRLKFNYRNNGVSFIEKVVNKFSSTYDKPAITKRV